MRRSFFLQSLFYLSQVLGRLCRMLCHPCLSLLVLPFDSLAILAIDVSSMCRDCSFRLSSYNIFCHDHLACPCQGCQADDNGQTDGRSDDGRWIVRDLDAL
jgi:hypothetical protein